MTHNNEVVGRIQESSRSDAQAAIAVASEAHAAWAETLTREEGKPLGEARGEVQRAIDICYYYAGKARDASGVR